FEDEDKTRSANLLNSILWAFSVIAFVGTTLLYAFEYFTMQETYQFDPVTLYFASVTIALNIILLFVMRQGYVQVTGFVWMIFLFIIITTALIQKNALHNPLVSIYIVLIMLAGLLLGTYAVLLFSVLSMITTLVITYIESNNIILISHSPSSFSDWIIYSFTFVLAGFLLRFALQNLNEALSGFQQKNRELERLSASLEERVKARTRALAASGEVSRSISTILDLDQLVTEVVKRVQAAFDYYHVHIYLLDEPSQKFKMVGGTGDAGLAMLAAGHALSMGQGLVGKAAIANEPILVGDVQNEPTWLPNNLLPETKSETAVPIVLGEKVIGVLDVQHNQVNGLTEDDTQLLHTIANQVAIAIQNARSFASIQSQIQQEIVLNDISHRIQQAPTIESVLQIAAEKVGQALDVQKTTIQIRNAIHTNGAEELL
ncbi:MAG: GAF domain-containing protein, partial [Chloroflexi bacterium]|nr:GAF domain-containing protein [Chloroflexota bacterium]